MRKLLVIFSLLISIISFSNTDIELQKASQFIANGELKKAKIILKKLSNENLNKEIAVKVLNNLALISNSDNNIEESIDYYNKILDLHVGDNWYNINSNQKLLSYALNKNDFESAIKYIENINYLTQYSDVNFVADLIYLYEKFNKTDKISNLNMHHIDKMSENDKIIIYGLVFNKFYDENDIEKSKKYLDKIKSFSSNLSKIYEYIYSNKLKNIYDEKLNIDDIDLTIVNDNIDINVLEELKKIYIKNNQLEKAYKVINIILEKTYTPRIVMQALKLAIIFKDEINIKKYTNYLEMTSDGGYNLGVAYFNEGMDKYAEKYLFKVLRENDKRSYYILLRIYFNNFDDKGLENLLNIALEKNMISKIEKNQINYEYLQYKEYKNWKERVGVK